MKRRIYHISTVGYWLLAISFVALSCTDDITPSIPEGVKNGQLIQFTVDDTQDWYQTKDDEMLTRGISSKAFAPHTIVMTSSEGATNMKLTSTVVPSLIAFVPRLGLNVMVPSAEMDTVSNPAVSLCSVMEYSSVVIFPVLRPTLNFV